MLNYAHITTLLYNILYKCTKLDWTTNCDTAFKELKHALLYTLILVTTNFDADLVVESDATDVVVSAILIMQHD